MTNLRLVETPRGSARPPEPRRLAVTFHVFDRQAPHGRSRPFKIKDADLHELLAAADRLEARR